MTGQRLAPWLLSAMVLVGCGRTSRDCDDCEPVQGQAGAAGTTAGGTSGLAGTTSTSGGEQTTGGTPSSACNLGALDAPLVRYSSVDLEWTMDELLGDGPLLARDGTERSEQGGVRSAHVAFVRSLLESVQTRVGALQLDDLGLECDADANQSLGCVENWIRGRGLLIYRRPLTEEQVAAYLAQFSALATDSQLTAARSVLMSMLLSPYFVFRIELGEPSAMARDAEPPGSPPAFPGPMLPVGTALTQFEVAARLSHFILRSAPDLTLLEHAANGQLRGASALRAEAERLLQKVQSGRARALQHLEWLHLDNLQVDALGDPLSFTAQAQTAAFISDVLENRNGSFIELLTSSRQPLNRPLAELYGIEADVGDDLQLVTLDPSLYAGVLGQGAWLTRWPRPTHRGLKLRERLLCSPVPPPPDGPMNGLVGVTPRERILNATSVNASCRGCHQLMDPIGFALEAFDEYGRLTGFDTSGELPSLSSSPVRLSGPLDLGNAVAQSPEAHLCAAKRYVEYLLQRESEDPAEQAMFTCLVRSFPQGDLDLNNLTLEVAASDAMLRTRRPATVAVAGGVSAELDPLRHAIEETRGLSATFNGTDRAALDLYQDSLRQIAVDLP